MRYSLLIKCSVSHTISPLGTLPNMVWVRAVERETETADD